MDFNMAEVSDTMARYLLALGVGHNEDTDIEVNICGGVMHMRVKDLEGDVVLSVVGESSEELGAQLALACLHNISVEHLGVLHREPLKEVSKAARRENLKVLPGKSC